MIKKLIPVVVIVVMVVFLGILLMDEKKDEAEQSAQYTEMTEQMRPLLVKKQQLERKLKELEENYISEHSPKGTTQIIFTEMDPLVYTEIYPIMEKYEFTGILSISMTEYPGAEGCMTVPQFKELIGAGWTTSITWDTESKLSAWWMILTAKIQELGIEMPTTAYFKSGAYSSTIDDTLKEKGITAVFHHGEEHSLIQLSYEEDLWHLGAVGLMGEKPRFRMEEAIETKGNVAFLVGFEREDELYNENSFVSMLNFFDTYTVADEMLVGSVEDTAKHYQMRNQDASGDVNTVYTQKKTELETELANVNQQLEQLEAE